MLLAQCSNQLSCLATNQSSERPTQLLSLSLLVTPRAFNFKANQWVNAQAQLHQQKIETNAL